MFEDIPSQPSRGRSTGDVYPTVEGLESELSHKHDTVKDAILHERVPRLPLNHQPIIGLSHQATEVGKVIDVVTHRDDTSSELQYAHDHPAAPSKGGLQPTGGEPRRTPVVLPSRAEVAAASSEESYDHSAGAVVKTVTSYPPNGKPGYANKGEFDRLVWEKSKADACLGNRENCTAHDLSLMHNEFNLDNANRVKESGLPSCTLEREQHTALIRDEDALNHHHREPIAHFFSNPLVTYENHVLAQQIYADKQETF
ncbi:hypothetical protein Pmar_PMAR016565 [Perkinsus marinus ATCC 50983]|uniref:Uncharacterized protein n=1 Tax=Perkinsus marinus (strain ATCC 50983 / TXsc) TaxID=423536 RepID=C5KTI6_PERM5|nr:hypothetical protein Pmar_PMAR016565 [Perkinsus marinus ATCC 50983]EER12165.1 hypothetical protein Pmar_PMAR016565 [Perkinsus marinus ATCC 50983]|eukprot:XP_002780370.1 hypothetical protein Pmar_PMAR016565 [Perkinsus marinus ATCC 50983]